MIKPLSLALGPIMCDVPGYTLTSEDERRLLNPLVGGVILFTRNYQNSEQLRALTKKIKQLRQPELLIAVDQEGGRVQRFKTGFTRLPAAAYFGQLYDANQNKALEEAICWAKLMASELINVGVDFSFAPIFDINTQDNDVIGDRCFHLDPNIAIALLSKYIEGMHTQGMPAVAKHFPGHGGVVGDSHLCLPKDERDMAALQAHDLIPYRALLSTVQAVMSAHVLYPLCDPQIATYSRYWLHDVLRVQLGFSGVVFSDDLTMQGAIDIAEIPISIIKRCNKSLAAGCDMLLICNRPDLVDEVLANGLDKTPDNLTQKLTRLYAN